MDVVPELLLHRSTSMRQSLTSACNASTHLVLEVVVLPDRKRTILIASLDVHIGGAKVVASNDVIDLAFVSEPCWPVARE